MIDTDVDTVVLYVWENIINTEGQVYHSNRIYNKSISKIK